MSSDPRYDNYEAVIARYEEGLTRLETVNTELRRMRRSRDVAQMIQLNEELRASLKRSIAVCREAQGLGSFFANRVKGGIVT